MKPIFTFAAIFVMLPLAYAQNTEAPAAPLLDSPENEVEVEEDEARIQIMERVREEVGNTGDDLRIQIMERAQEETSTRRYLETLTPAEIRERVQNAKQNMSEVAKRATELAQDPDRFGGIGEEISSLAQEQNEAQRRIEENFDLVERRTGILRFILGPNRTAVDNLSSLLEENEERILQLEEKLGEVDNEEAREELEEMIEALKDQNVVLHQKIEDGEMPDRSIFGIITSLFARFQR